MFSTSAVDKELFSKDTHLALKVVQTETRNTAVTYESGLQKEIF